MAPTRPVSFKSETSVGGFARVERQRLLTKDVFARAQ